MNDQETLVKAVIAAIRQTDVWKYVERMMEQDQDNDGMNAEDDLDGLDGLDEGELDDLGGMEDEELNGLDFEPDEDEVGMGGPQYADHGREPAVNMERTRYSRASRYQPRSYSKAQLDQVVNHALARGVSFEVARNELEYYQ
jgi:hypothetical protein